MSHKGSTVGLTFSKHRKPWACEGGVLAALGGRRVQSRIRRHVMIEAGLLAEVKQMLAARPDSNLSEEVNTALREHVRRNKAQQEEILLAPVIERLLKERVDQMESWLRSGVWAGATYSATASLLLLEILCGQKVDPREAKAHLELIRGRAWKMVRKGADERLG